MPLTLLYIITFGLFLLGLYALAIGVIWLKNISFMLKLCYSLIATLALPMFIAFLRLPPVIKEFASWQIAIVGAGFLISLLSNYISIERKLYSTD